MSRPPQRVLVLMGGPDAERDVSLASGRAVADALRASNAFDVVESVIERITVEDLRATAPRGTIDVIFPVLHGTWGEGGGLQAVLEAHEVPFVGSHARASELAMDKIATKDVATAQGLATPLAREIGPHDACDIEPPIVLKPVDDGSSVDLRICRTRDEVVAARHDLHGRRARLMAEQYVAGREVTAGIVGGRALPLIEIVPAVEFYDYAAKYERADTRYQVDPDLPADVTRRCRDDAMRLYRAVGCRDLARVDFIVEDGRPWFLEINTIPGFTDHSLLPMAARATGVEMPELCAGLAHAAMRQAVGSGRF